MAVGGFDDVAAQIGDEFGDRHAQDQRVFDDKHLLAVTGLGCIDLFRDGTQQGAAVVAVAPTGLS